MIDENQSFRLKADVSPFQQLREYLGYERSEIGRILGVDYDTVLSWETGKREPRFTWQQIQVLEELFERIGQKFRDFPPYLGPPPPNTLDQG